MSLDKRGGRARSPMRKPFVIQQHKAKNMHWDLRLFLDGKMWSLALPKGPSLNPGEARLAVETKPHDVKYSRFEGTIEKGLYGAGKVLQWDKGTFNTIGKKDSLKEQIDDGLVKFELHGEKLKGDWALVKTYNNWLLIKMNDRYARKDMDVVKDKPKSVKSGKTINKITREDGLIYRGQDLGF